MAQAVDVSVVVPVFNERDSLAELHRRVAEVLAGQGLSFELVFIDDGSSDGSDAVLRDLRRADPRVRVATFRRNFGKAAALAAGFERARGAVVVTMDADLQDDPAEIPRFLARLDEGFDIVSGWKQDRQDPWDKTLPSRLFNKVVRAVSGVRLNDFNCGFKAYRAEALAHLRLYGELHRFIPVLLFWRGFSVGEIPVRHHARRHGRSKYGLSRLVKGFFDLLTVVLTTRFQQRPLHLFGFVGSVFGALGVLILLYLTVLWFAGLGPIGTRPLLFLGLLLVVVGVQLVSTGLIAEFVRNAEGLAAPTYVVREDSDGDGGPERGD
jgi:glycosyltransferase involved in cell wall biosynthesis